MYSLFLLFAICVNGPGNKRTLIAVTPVDELLKWMERKIKLAVRAATELLRATEDTYTLVCVGFLNIHKPWNDLKPENILYVWVWLLLESSSYSSVLKLR